MRRKSFEMLERPIACSLERAGEWWIVLGARRLEQFQKGLVIASNMLTRRLGVLVAAGMLEKRRDSERPPRDEYLLAERGRDFRPVLWSLLACGNRHFAPEDPTAVIVDAGTGAPARPMLMDAASLRPLKPPSFRTVPGPDASDDVRKHHGVFAGAAASNDA